jgi:putative transposase
MARAYSMELRERVVAAVEGGLSRRQAAARFGVGYSVAIYWLKRFREFGSVAPGQMGGHKPRKISGEHRDWLMVRCRERAFTLHGLVGELDSVDIQGSGAAADVIQTPFREEF